jgi:hypothetical protein
MFGNTDGKILTSTDGTMWKNPIMVVSPVLHSVIYGNNRFVAVGDKGVILTSENGTSWSKLNSTLTNRFEFITYGNNLFVAVGDMGMILTSKPDISGIAFQNGFTTANISKIKIFIVNNHISALLPYPVKQDRFTVSLFTVAGRRIYSDITRIQNGTLTIPALEFPTGMYILSITDHNNTTVSSAFVLMR